MTSLQLKAVKRAEGTRTVRKSDGLGDTRAAVRCSPCVGLGANAGLTGGYYAQHWFAAGELGFDYALTTHIAHAQLYRDRVFENARDGWYVNSGGNYRLGGQAGASFGRYELALRAGILRAMMGGRPMFPLYATVALSAGW